MINIMRADMYRILRGKAIYITFAIVLVLTILMVYIFRSAPNIGVTIDDPYFMVAAETMSGAIAATMALGSMDNLTAFFLVIFSIIAVDAFACNAIKNELSTGASRTKLFMSKWMLSSLVSIGLMLLYLLISVIFATTVDGFGYWGDGLFLDVLQAFGAQAVITMALCSVGVFLSFTLRKSGAVIGIYLAVIFAPTMILALLSLAFPDVMDLLRFDLNSQYGVFAQMATQSATDIARGFAIGLGFLIVSIVGGIMLFKRAEIK